MTTTVQEIAESYGIKPTADSKTWQTDRKDKNTFGLLPGPVEEGGTCPGCTTSEKGCWSKNANGKHTCYAARLSVFRPNVNRVLMHNTMLLLLYRGERRVKLFTDEFERYLKEYDKTPANKRLRSRGLPAYRLHWSGDCPDVEYARDLAEAMRRFNGRMVFWGYTRTFDTVPIMAGLPNVVWYMSLDEDNLVNGMVRLHKWSGKHNLDNIRLCYMGKSMPEGFTACGSDSMESHEGACARCGICFNTDENAKRNIYFKTR